MEGNIEGWRGRGIEKRSRMRCGQDHVTISHWGCGLHRGRRIARERKEEERGKEEREK